MLHRFETFVTGITTCYKCIGRIKNMEMTEFGLKGTHVMCLFFLHRNPEGLTAAQLCQLCAEDKAAISRTVSLLQERGYVEATDRKYRAALRLTQAGLAIARQIDSLIAQWVERGSEGLSEEDRTAFYRALEIIAGNLQGAVSQDRGFTPPAEESADGA
ncbi:MAG: MarR family winged helix-turn-helix transcriptional regulator [Aristaeellaceae bacterium]